MLVFDEYFTSGFFGLGRTYGVHARFECESVRELESAWQEALRETLTWRASRADRANALDFWLLVPSYLAWEAILFITPRVVRPPSSLPEQLRGVKIEVIVNGMPGLDEFLKLVLYPEATSKEQKAIDHLDDV